MDEVTLRVVVATVDGSGEDETLAVSAEDDVDPASTEVERTSVVSVVGGGISVDVLWEVESDVDDSGSAVDVDEGGRGRGQYPTVSSPKKPSHRA